MTQDIISTQNITNQDRILYFLKKDKLANGLSEISEFVNLSKNDTEKVLHDMEKDLQVIPLWTAFEKE